VNAYLVADVEITDPAGFEEYRGAVPATIAAYGGRYLVRGGETEVLEGDVDLHRVIVLEFPSMERLRAWYDSPEYRPLIALRERTARTTLWAVEGVD
jgi:uncharacterized protein (DUF1330 family)